MTETADPIARQQQATPAAEPCLSALIEALKQTGDDRFDPVRFRYLEAMVRRARNLPSPAAQRVEGKARMALAQYQRDRCQARQEAEASLQRVLEQFPGRADRCRRLFSDGEFDRLRRFEAGLLRDRHARAGARAALAALTDQIIRLGRSDEDSQGPFSLDDVLRQQEQDILRATADAVPLARPAELKSVRLFRQSWVKAHSDKRVSRAVEEGPENPGPLNQEKLAIATLTALRDLSPQYLSRFVSHIDTLLWLEQADQLDTATRKRAGGGKAGKKPGSRRRS